MEIKENLENPSKPMKIKENPYQRESIKSDENR